MTLSFKIKKFPEYYVTDQGDIYSRNYARTGRIKKLKLCQQKDGYLLVDIRGKKYSVHRIVAETFIPNPEQKRCINHKNGIKTDNRVENLEWCTYSENMQHSYDKLNHEHLKGAKHPLSKKLIQMFNGETVREFASTGEASKITGINQSNISACCRHIRNHAGGFQWKYKD